MFFIGQSPESNLRIQQLWMWIKGSRRLISSIFGLFQLSRQVITMTSALESSSCLSTCKTEFANSIFPHDTDYSKVCGWLLLDSSLFFGLYCCDSLCGFQFSQQNETCQDSNVNEIRTRCQSMGISNIVDPGPPALSKCSILWPPQPSKTLLPSPPSTVFSSSIAISTTAAGTTSIPNYTGMEMWSSAVGTLTLTSSSTLTASTVTTVTSSGMQVSSNQSGGPPRSWQSWNSGTKLGCIVGTIIIFLAILVLITIFITRRKRREQALSSPNGDQLYGPPPKITVEVIAAGEPKTSLDSSGIRWPEGVVLTGDAKEIHEWTTEYDRDYKGRMSLSVARMEKECEYQVENSVRALTSREMSRSRS